MLGDGQVGIHPFVIGEIACGDFTARGEILSMLECLPAMPVATRSEALFFLERNHIGGNGIGYAEKGLLNECTRGKTVALDIRRISAPFRSCP